MKIRRRRPAFFDKAAAVFLAITLVLCNSVSYAEAPSTVIARSSTLKGCCAEGDEAISIPSAYGTIEESFQSSSGKMVIYIQDAHDSLEAQENIAKIINHLVGHYGVKTVFEEGYEGPVPTDQYFSFVKDPVIKKKISYFLMDKLRLGGAEYAHVNRKKDFKLIGADSIKLHLENIKQYQESARHKIETEKDLDAIDREIKRLADQHFPKGLKEWMRLKERVDKGKLDLLSYLKRMTALSPSLTIPAHINLLLRAEGEKDLQAIQTTKEIDPKILFQEVDLLENNIANYFLKNERDRRIFQNYKNLGLLERLNDVRLSPDEYELVKTTLQKLKTASFASFIVETTGKSIVLSKRWEQNIQNAVRFYEIAETRDQQVSKRLDAFLASPDEKLAVMVFGGFHKNRLEKILKQKQISCVTVSPKITSISEIHQRYYQELMSVGRLPFEPSSYVRTAAPAGRAMEVITDTDLPSYLLEMSVFPGELKESIRSEMREKPKVDQKLKNWVEEFKRILSLKKDQRPVEYNKLLKRISKVKMKSVQMDRLVSDMTTMQDADRYLGMILSGKQELLQVSAKHVLRSVAVYLLAKAFEKSTGADSIERFAESDLEMLRTMVDLYNKQPSGFVQYTDVSSLFVALKPYYTDETEFQNLSAQLQYLPGELAIRTVALNFFMKATHLESAHHDTEVDLRIMASDLNFLLKVIKEKSFSKMSKDTVEMAKVGLIRGLIFLVPFLHQAGLEGHFPEILGEQTGIQDKLRDLIFENKTLIRKIAKEILDQDKYGDDPVLSGLTVHGFYTDVEDEIFNSGVTANLKAILKEGEYLSTDRILLNLSRWPRNAVAAAFAQSHPGNYFYSAKLANIRNENFTRSLKRRSEARAEIQLPYDKERLIDNPFLNHISTPGHIDKQEFFEAFLKRDHLLKQEIFEQIDKELKGLSAEQIIQKVDEAFKQVSPDIDTELVGNLRSVELKRRLTLRELYLHPSHGETDLPQILFAAYEGNPQYIESGLKLGLRTSIEQRIKIIYLILRGLEAMSRVSEFVLIRLEDIDEANGELAHYLRSLSKAAAGEGIWVRGKAVRLLSLADLFTPVDSEAQRTSLRHLLALIDRLQQEPLWRQTFSISEYQNKIQMLKKILVESSRSEVRTEFKQLRVDHKSGLQKLATLILDATSHSKLPGHFTKKQLAAILKTNRIKTPINGVIQRLKRHELLGRIWLSPSSTEYYLTQEGKELARSPKIELSPRQLSSIDKERLTALLKYLSNRATPAAGVTVEQLLQSNFLWKLDIFSPLAFLSRLTTIGKLISAGSEQGYFTRHRRGRKIYYRVTPEAISRFSTKKETSRSEVRTESQKLLIVNAITLLQTRDYLSLGTLMNYLEPAAAIILKKGYADDEAIQKIRTAMTEIKPDETIELRGRILQGYQNLQKILELSQDLTRAPAGIDFEFVVAVLNYALDELDKLEHSHQDQDSKVRIRELLQEAIRSGQDEDKQFTLEKVSLLQEQMPQSFLTLAFYEWIAMANLELSRAEVRKKYYQITPQRSEARWQTHRETVPEPQPVPSEPEKVPSNRAVIFVNGSESYDRSQARARELAVLAASDPRRTIVVYNGTARNGLIELLKSFGLQNIKFVPGVLSQAVRPYQYRQVDLVHYSGNEREALSAGTATGLNADRLTRFVGDPGALGYGLKYLAAVRFHKPVEDIQPKNGYYLVSPRASESMRLFQEARFVVVFAQAA